ncbi:MAG: type I glutamate--ammonia ligase [Anaerolineaceae bacterium]|nr:type I glutamate--ammonia ligase [Anaerolineaceae bacterium]
MFQDFDAAKKYVQENEIRMIDLKWCDLFGRWHHISVSAEYFTPQMMRDGIGFDGSAVGFKPVNAGDMVLIPDISTAFLDPFFKRPTLSFLADIYEADTKERFDFDPRQIVAKAEAYLKQTGIADQSVWGPEYEFFILDEASYENRLNSSGYTLTSYEADWVENATTNGYLVPNHHGYHRIAPSDQNQDLRNEISLMMEDYGYKVKYHHHEAGGPGHGEIEPPLQDIYKSTDGSLMVKYLAKNMAFQQGKTITFMPKPFFGAAGTGLHFHQLLMKGKKNIFYDATGYANLSENALYYVGGILDHAAALCAITNPSTNSYKRLAPGFEAPTSCFFGKGDRNAAIRAPKYATDPGEARIEYRTPDATCNPYLAIPAMLLAGLDGIARKVDPRSKGYGPFDDDVLGWPEYKQKKIKKVPFSLAEALTALEKDHAFLTGSGVFSNDFIKFWVKTLRKESNDILTRPIPIEIERYLDC